MSKDRRDQDQDVTEGEQREGFAARRMRAFADRSRDPGDGATWAVVLASAMLTLLIICLSVARETLLAFIVFVAALVWVALMGLFANVNVASILWGSATTDSKDPPIEIVVYQSTLVIALISLVAIIIDAFTGVSFGWWGLVLFITIAVYMIVYIQSWLRPTRHSE